jgi:hypothetical protein
MNTTDFQKQLFVNLKVDANILFNAISANKNADDVMVIYQYLTGNLDPIPQLAKYGEEIYTFESFDVFNLTVKYSYANKKVVFFKDEETANKYKDNLDYCPYKYYSNSKTDECPFECEAIRRGTSSTDYSSWINHVC